MKKSILLLLISACAMPSSALIKVESSLNDGQKMGKFKDIKKAPKEIYIGQFCVWYKTWRQSTGKDESSIIMRRELDLSEDTAMAETKTFKKHAKKKGNDANISQGGAYYHKPENNPNDYRIGTWANGVVSAYLGHKAKHGSYGVLSHELGGKDGKISLSVILNVDFLNWDVSHTSTHVIQAGAPELRMKDDILLGQTYFAWHNNKERWRQDLRWL